MGEQLVIVTTAMQGSLDSKWLSIGWNCIVWQWASNWRGHGFQLNSGGMSALGFVTMDLVVCLEVNLVGSRPVRPHQNGPSIRLAVRFDPPVLERGFAK